MPSAFVRTLFYLFAALSALLSFPTPPAKILLRSPLLDLCELNFCANFSMEFSHPLKSAFIPHAVAVVGASDREGSRGTYVWNGVMNGRRALEAYPVNPKYKYIGVTPCWASLSELPAKIDLAVITTPASTVMGLLKECKKLGIGNVLLCPGDDAFTRDRHWRREVAQFAAASGLRLIGPFSMGIMRPSIGLNVSYWPQLAESGSIALISQSGAVTASILDFAARSAVGFSSIISSGIESDVSLAEIIDFFIADPQTEIIALQIDTLYHPRSFLSAVRAASRTKPVIVLKAGRGPNAERVTASHLASVPGSELVFDAALERAGAVRCDRVEDFCTTLEVFACGKNPRQGRLAVLANGIGFAALAADACDAAGVALAEFPAELQKEFRRFLGPSSPILNPLTLGSDASPELFANALKLALACDSVDGAVVTLAPSALIRMPRTVQLLAQTADESFKPVIVNWTTDATDPDTRLSFKRCRLPCVSTPDLAARSFANLVKSYALKQKRHAAPREASEFTGANLEVARVVIADARAKGEHVLNDEQTVQLLSAFGIRSLPSSFAATSQEAVAAARRIGFPVVLKLSANGVAHKTDVGGVLLNVLTESAVAEGFAEIRSKLAELAPMARFNGVFVQKMAENQHARELSIRAATDPVLGPAIYFGAGGRTGEIFTEETIGIAPLTEPMALEMISRHPVAASLERFRGMPAVHKEALAGVLLRISTLLCELPAVAEVVINPLVADEHGVVALDASMSLCARADKPDARYSHMLIAPTPTLFDEEITTSAGLMRVRSVRPDDFAAEKRLLGRLSARTAYMRFHKNGTDVTDDEIIDFTQIDHDREAARVVVDNSNVGPEMHGVGRIFIAPGSKTAEFGILIEDDYQRAGLGSILMQQLEDEARRRGCTRIQGFVLKGNDPMAGFMASRGYRAVDCPQDANMLIYELLLAEKSSAGKH